VKRLLVLLIVLAGGLAAAAFTVPTNAAVVNGTTITQNQLNNDVTAVANSLDYQCFLSAEELVGSNGASALPAVDGVNQSATDPNHSAITAAFVGTYLDTEIGQQVAIDLAAQRHLVPTAADLTTARAALKAQITAVFQDVGETQVCALTQLPTAAEVLTSMPAAFIARTIAFDASVTLLEESYSGYGTKTAGLERYFEVHKAQFDNACFTVAQYTSAAAAQADAAKAKAGTPFATLAAAQPGGGPQGCFILAGISASLPAGTNLASLPLNTVSAPIAEGSAYLLVEITARMPTPFASAKSEVLGAVQSAGATKARTAIMVDEAKASVSVDPRYGTWSAKQSHILTPTPPLTADTLNPDVNTQQTAAAAPASGATLVPPSGQAG
jgi:hypothetical protein